MKEERSWPVLGTWLKDTAAAPPDPQETARKVAERLPQTPQVRRRWWLPSQRAAHQPSPIQATSGHTPTVIGRTKSMLSPVKTITAGALVFAIGSVFLIAQPFDQQPVVPGAETEAVAPTWVTGNISFAPGCTSPDSDEVDGAVRRSRNVECSPQAWTSSDLRLTAEVSRWYNEDTFQTDEGSITVNMDAAYLRNDGGGWACSNSGLLRGSGMSSKDVTGGTFTHTCIGDGGYEGLSAILVLDQAGAGNSEEFVGLIFSGDFPPLPEPPSVE
jgi:hypothetical protein